MSQECKKKYDEETYALFMAAFNQLCASHELHPAGVVLLRCTYHTLSSKFSHVYRVIRLPFDCHEGHVAAVVMLRHAAFRPTGPRSSNSRRTMCCRPLAVILNAKVLVLHGGVDDELTLEELEQVLFSPLTLFLPTPDTTYSSFIASPYASLHFHNDVSHHAQITRH